MLFRRKMIEKGLVRNISFFDDRCHTSFRNAPLLEQIHCGARDLISELNFSALDTIDLAAAEALASERLDELV